MKKLSKLGFVMVAATLMLATGCTKKNNIPVVSAVMVTPAAVDAGQAATVTVTAVDLDNDPLTYSYQVTGGAITGAGPAVQWIAPSAAGAHSVTVTVSDGKGGTAIGNGALTVNEVIVTTQIKGNASFPAGVSGDLINSKISLYTTYNNWLNNQPIRHDAVTGSGPNVSFTVSNVNPGNYYLDIWKDNDNNAVWSIGDFVGWYGSGGLGSPALTEFQITEGQTMNITVNMLII